MARSAALGFRVKSGRAIAVVLLGPASAPEVWKRVDLTLSEVLQPYHPYLDLTWAESVAAVRPVARAIHRQSSAAVADLARKVRDAGLSVRGAGIVGGSDPDLATIGNLHIRAHAAEGLLFREALETAVRKLSMKYCYFVERKLLDGTAPERLTGVKALGKAVRPWRSDEKSAALAAWMML